MITRLLLAILVCLSSARLSAQELRALDVDFNDPEIRAFKERGSAPSPEFQNLDIPVVRLRTTTPSTGRSSAPGSSCSHGMVTNDDRRWYSIQYDCGGIVIVVHADRRYPPGSDTTPLDTNPKTVEIVPASGDPKDDAGLVASIRAFRYPNIPYTTFVTCTEKTRATCLSRKALLSIYQRHELVAVPAEPRAR